MGLLPGFGWAEAIPLLLGGLGYQGQKEANESNVTMAREASQTNLQSAREQMAFQERMSNTSYQRAMHDMQSAGLNPMLAYQQGGASTPSGASGSAVAGHVDSALQAGISTGLEARRLRKDIEAADSQVDLNKAIAKTQAAQTQAHLSNAMVAKKNAERLDAEMPAVKQEATVRQKRGLIDEKMIMPDAILKRTTEALGAIGSARSVFKKGYPTRRGVQEEMYQDYGDRFERRGVP